MRTFFHLLYLWATAGSIFIGLQVYLKDRNNRVNRIFALLCLSMTCWAFIDAELYYSIDVEMAGFWLIFAAFWPLPSSILLHFALVYTDYGRYLNKSTMLAVVYLPSIALIIIVQLLGGYSINEPPMYWGWSYSASDPLVVILEFIVLITLNAAGMTLCLVYYKKQHDLTNRKQAGLVLIGLSLPMLFGVVGHGLLPNLNINVPELSILGFVIGTGAFTGYAVWRYQLFDVTPAVVAEKIIATMTGALLLVDTRGSILTANESAQYMLGYGKHSLVGKNISAVLGDNEDLKEILANGESGEDFYDRETSFQARTGETVPVTLSKASMNDDGGNLLGTILIATDISDRKIAEQALQMRDEEFRALVEHTSDMVIRFDNGRRITYMNSTCSETFNTPVDEFLGKSCRLSSLPGSLANTWDEAVQQVIETGTRKKLEHELPSSGDARFFDTRLTPEFSEDGSIESVLVVSRDITEHVCAEKALTETERLYRHIFNQSTDVLVHLDRKSTILDINRRALEITGLKREDLVGKKISALSGIFTKASIGRMVKAFAERMIGATVQPYEVEAHVADGRRLFFEVSAAGLTDTAGKRIGEIAMLHDITERKMGEEKIRQQSGSLARRGEELAGLVQISSTISKNLEIDKLLDQALEEITSMKIMNVKPDGGIFILDGDRLTLAASRNIEDGFKKAHDDLRVGQCLCGIAASEGEILVSRNSSYESRHTISYPGINNHGDIIVPLIAPDGICGIMFLHTEPNINVQQRQLELLRTIGNQLGLAIKNSLLFEETRALSIHDPLTGLGNRNMLNIEMEKQQAVLRRNKEPLSMIMIDLDHFKQFNDTYGHATGDVILAALAGILKSEIREIDLAVRYGGEEFLLLLPDTSKELAESVAERIRHKVEMTTLTVTDDQEVSLTISLGVATSVDGSESPEILITRADTAMYMAKERGRNRVEEWIS